MAQKKRSKRSAAKCDGQQAVRRLLDALDGLPRPARRTLGRNIDAFKRHYPELYDVMFKDVDSEHYREFERHLERAQQRQRGES